MPYVDFVNLDQTNVSHSTWNQVLKGMCIRWPVTFYLIWLVSGCSGLFVPSDEHLRPSENSQAAPLTKEIQTVQKLYQQKKIDQTKTTLQRLIEDHPEQAPLYIIMGGLQLSEQDIEGAQSSLATALKYDPNNLAALNQLGVVLRMKGHFKQAEQTYQKVLTLQADYALVHYNLGILYDLYLAKPDQALKHYQRYQTLVGTQDQEINGWIIDLKRRTQSKP
jgi:tetratricopeptide (TPR) repeat protein